MSTDTATIRKEDDKNKIVYTDNSGITYTQEDVDACGGIAEIIRQQAGSYDR